MHEESVEFSSEGAPREFIVTGVLRIPEAERRLAAVVIAHGSNGPDSRGRFAARALYDAGLASLEIDMWAARGLKGGLDRPRNVADTLPDVFGAFRYLTSRAEVDALRIGIMGFSWGGVLAMLTATRAVARRYLRNGERFAAHAPLYPLCWLYNRVTGYEFRDLTGAPVLLQTGDADAYDAPDTLQKLLDSLDAADRACLQTIVYPGATHGFDQVEEAASVAIDPLAHEGAGGKVAFTPDRQTGDAARREVAGFFRRALGVP
jgi:dienelactone hydrolase